MGLFSRLSCAGAAATVALLAAVGGHTLVAGQASQCAFNGVDLASLTTRDWNGTDGTNVFQYVGRVCGPVRENVGACVEGGEVGAACQIQTTPSGPTYIAGFWFEPVWTTTNNGVQYKIEGANECVTGNGQSQTYTATFVFQCSAMQDAHFIVATNLCDETWTMNTPAACITPPPPPPPQPNTSCGYGGIDLTSLTTQDWSGADGGKFFGYLGHVCGPVENPGACVQNGQVGAACQTQEYPVNGSTYITGFWWNPQWSMIENGVQYTIQGAKTCKPKGFAQPYSATFVFLCSATQDEQFTVAPGVCDETWTMNTPAACFEPPPCSYAGFDFSSLIGTEQFIQDPTQPPNTSGWWVNICSALSSNAACYDATLPMQSICHANANLDLGDWNATEAVWSLTGGRPGQTQAISYTLTSGTPCGAGYETSTLSFVCASETTSLKFAGQAVNNVCASVFEIGTPLACGKPSASVKHKQIAPTKPHSKAHPKSTVRAPKDRRLASKIGRMVHRREAPHHIALN